MKGRLQLKQVQKQKMKLSRRKILIAGTISLLALAIGLTITFNFSNVSNSMASTGTALPASFATGFENGVSDWTTSGTGTWGTSATANSGVNSAKLTTPTKSAANSYSNITNYNYGITVPSTGTYYITILAKMKADNASGSAFIGLYDKVNNVSKTSSVVSTATSWGLMSYTFPVTDGNTYYPVLAGARSSNGTGMGIYFDDFVMYISTSKTTDATAPTVGSNLNVSNSSALNISLTSGADSVSGIDGCLILRTNSYTQNSPTLSDYVDYSPSSKTGPTSISSSGTWAVVSNGTSGTSGSDTSSTLKGTYTYLVFMRDKAYHYSATPLRAYVLIGSGQTAKLGASTQTIDALYIGAGATLTHAGAGYTLTLTNGLVDGTFVNTNITSVARTGTFTFSSTGTFYQECGNGNDARSIPTITWQSGSTCIVNNPTSNNLSTAVGGLSQNFSNFTWNASKQTVTSTMSGATISGNLEIDNTGSSSLILSDSLKIGGNYKQTGGTLNFSTSSSCFIFNGSSSQSYTVSAGSLTGTMNLIVNNTDSLHLKTALTIGGTLGLYSGVLDNVSYGATLSSGASLVRKSGIVINTPSFSGTYNMTYNGTCTTGSELPSSTSKINKLTINTTGTITLGKSITVNDSLVLKKGIVQAGDYNITVANGAKITAYSSKSFIVTNGKGSLVINSIGSTGTTTAVSFPVGTTVTSYTPVTVKNTGTTDAFSVRVYEKMYDKYGSDNLPSSDAIEYNANNVRKTWLVEEGTAGGSNVTLTLQWNALDEANGFDRSNSYIAHYTSSLWQKNKPSTPTGSDPYVLSLSGISSFSPFGVGDANASLPVEMTSFSVTKEQNIARLEWETATEINNDRFEVERSTDAKQWEKIGSVPGNGTTSSKEDYDYVDHDVEILTDKIIYYRLKQVDYNGKFEYSDIKKLQLGSAETGNVNKDFRLWYNPSDQKIYADIENPNGAIMQATLINMAGKVISQQSIAADQNQIKMNFDMTSLANGVYSVIVEGNGDPKSLKIIKTN